MQQEIIETIEKFDVGVKDEHDVNPQIIYSSGKKQQKDSQINPFLIFHSPEQSQKSPFKKRKKITKLLKLQLPPPPSTQKIQSQNLQKIKNFKQKLCFTSNTITDCKLGMLLTSRICEQRTNNFVYSTHARTVINIPQCAKCGRMFKNHSGLGGHMRLCKNDKKIHQNL